MSVLSCSIVTAPSGRFCYPEAPASHLLCRVSSRLGEYGATQTKEAGMGNDVEISREAIKAWTEAEASARGESVEDLDASSFGGEVAGEEAAALINAADSEGLFTGPSDLPTISLNAYAHDGDALLLGLRPRMGGSGGSAWAYGQVGSYVVEVAEFGFVSEDSPGIEEVLNAAAEIASDLIPLYRAVCEACSLAGEIPRDEPSYEQAVGLALRAVRKEKQVNHPALTDGACGKVLQAQVDH
ncbi:MAG: hypothetical protein ACYCST_15885 [Acidimicrobiales bacterium]